MVRLFNIYHPSRTFVLFCSEILLTVVCLIAAFSLLQGSQTYAMLSQPAGIGQLLVMAATCVLCLYYFDFYNFQSLVDLRELLIRLLQMLGTTALILGLIYGLFPRLVVARGIYFLASPILLGVLFLARVGFLHFNQLPKQSERVILLGSGALSCDLARETRVRPELGINLIGYVDDQEPEAHSPLPLGRLGSTSELEGIIAQSRANSIIVALDDRRGRLPVDVLLNLRVAGMRIHEARSVYERITGKIPVDDARPSWLIFSDGFRTHAKMNRIRRVYSFFFAAFTLLLSLPVMGFVAILIKLNSKGPALFRQKRVGRKENVFTLYKFRSMRADAEAQCGAVWSVENDPRITRVGRFLRKFRLDELPQLWNVLRGDMNLVGPRPERPEFLSLLKKEIPYYSHRHSVRPGVTGWAQVRYNYGSTLEEQAEKLRYDLFYVKNVSLSLDFYILVQTIKIVLWGRGAK